jgi:hypothetical protein
MSESWPDVDLIRSRRITLGRILHELDDEPRRASWRMAMDDAAEGNVSGWLGEFLGQEPILSEWTHDILASVGINDDDWAKHVVGKFEADEATAGLDLAKTLRTRILLALEDGINNGQYDGITAAITLGLTDTLHVDLCGQATAWGGPGGYDYELQYSAVFRRV